MTEKKWEENKIHFYEIVRKDNHPRSHNGYIHKHILIDEEEFEEWWIEEHSKDWHIHIFLQDHYETGRRAWLESRRRNRTEWG